MPDRRRHGAHEDRGAGGARGRSTGCRCTTGWSAICRATRPLRRSCRGCSICATVLPGAAKLSEAVAGFSARRTLPHWRARRVRRSTRSRVGRDGRRAKSCCSPTPSTAISSARISMPRSRCCTPAAIACMSRRRSTARRGRCAAAAPSSRSARSTRRGAKRSARSRRSRRSSRAACRSSGSSRAACSASATKSRRWCKARRAQQARRASAAVRGISGARGRGRAGSSCRSKPIAERALLHGHCHQKAFDAMGAVETVLKARARTQGRDRSNRAAAAWRAPSATRPTPSTSRWRWASCRCCPRCARRRADTLIVADGTSAATRSTTAPAARRCMSRACWQ